MSVEEDVGDTLLRLIRKLLCPELLLRETPKELLRLSSLLFAEEDVDDNDPLAFPSLGALSLTVVDIPAMSKKNIDNNDPLNR